MAEPRIARPDTDFETPLRLTSILADDDSAPHGCRDGGQADRNRGEVRAPPAPRARGLLLRAVVHVAALSAGPAAEPDQDLRLPQRSDRPGHRLHGGGGRLLLRGRAAPGRSAFGPDHDPLGSP